MKTVLWIGWGIVAAVVLVVVVLSVGWTLWGRPLWAAGPFAMPRMAAGAGTPDDCGGWGYGMDPGMMGRGSAPAASCAGWDYGMNPGLEDGGTTAPSDALAIEEARQAVERYIAALGYSSLEVIEVMEFERNFYAIVRESDTGIGAMELLVDKWTGDVGPEMGPNMMWNTRYGMHGRSGRMMGGTSETNALSPEEVLEVAQRWLDTYRPGVTVEEHADPFYGYYTIHTLQDGDIEGMLSVHGTTGQVWYHTWHDRFIQMIPEEEAH
jgi:hypothetical protein